MAEPGIEENNIYTLSMFLSLPRMSEQVSLRGGGGDRRQYLIVEFFLIAIFRFLRAPINEQLAHYLSWCHRTRTSITWRKAIAFENFGFRHQAGPKGEV